MERVRVHVFAGVGAAEQDAVREAFAAADGVGKTVTARGSVPLTEVLLVGSVATHAVAYLINTLRKSWSKGVVIDAVGRQVTVRNNPALPRGIVVVRSKSGEVTVRDGAGLADVLGGVLPGRGGDPATGSASGSGPASGPGSAPAAGSGSGSGEATGAGGV